MYVITLDSNAEKKSNDPTSMRKEPKMFQVAKLLIKENIRQKAKNESNTGSNGDSKWPLKTMKWSLDFNFIWYFRICTLKSILDRNRLNSEINKYEKEWL